MDFILSTSQKDNISKLIKDTTTTFMSFNVLDKIIKRRLKYMIAPYLLSAEDYCGYLKVEQAHHRAWAMIFLAVDGLVLLGLLTILLLYKAGYFWIGSLTLGFFGSLLMNGIYAASSRSTNIFWRSLFLLSLFLFLFSIWAISVNASGVILTYLSVSHLISLIKIRDLI